MSRSLAKGGQLIGYIAIRLFTPGSGGQVREAVESLVDRGVRRFILDLRNNPGGYLDAMAVAGSAFTDRPLGSKVRRNDRREPIVAQQKPLLQQMRMAVLINQGTASAAEILAAGLRDTIGATLVGARSFGRGQIQAYVALGDNAGLMIPVATVESPRGTRFGHESGLVPDISVPAADLNRGNDRAYQRAVELLAHN